MKNKFFKSSLGNIYSKPSIKSEVSSQILYGEKFKILLKKKNWIKIKTNFDNYVGFIKKEKFNNKFIPSRKIFKLKSSIYKKKQGKFLQTSQFLYFATRISIKNTVSDFIEFEKNKWIKKKRC